MSPSTPKARHHEWMGYYQRFNYFSADAVRDGCQPRMMEHEEPTEKAIVLVHGLTDSPYFMTAIGDYFFTTLGYNVYLPLLHCHGLKEPKGMEGVKLDEWKSNVNFALDVAASKANQVAIGGLSTGGTLSFYAAATNPKIGGTLYLFSAGLDLADRRGCLGGDLMERLFRTFLVDIFDRRQPLIGENPYRYNHMDFDGARELSYLIKETDALIKQFSPQKPFSKKVFAAHSESDTTADIAGIEKLQKVSDPKQFTFFRIAKELDVPHASVVLKEPVYATPPPAGKLLEDKNPGFQDMMEAIAAIE